jgi:hypothetical protein
MTETNEVAFSSGVVVLTFFFSFFGFSFFDYGDVFSATSFSPVFLDSFHCYVVAKQFAYGTKYMLKSKMSRNNRRIGRRTLKFHVIA